MSYREAGAEAQDLAGWRGALTHDLRGPLNGILAWTQVLEDRLDDPPPDVSRALAGIRAGIRDQVRLIERLLESRHPGAAKRAARP